MKELSLNILDLVQNSITAGARNVGIAVSESGMTDLLTLSIEDDGCGMDAAFLAQVTDPFTTTRTTRKVGMGIPLFKMEAELSGGGFQIESEKGRGTKLHASFQLSHIDRPPLGDMADTMTVLVQGSPDVDFLYLRGTDRGSFRFSTKEVRETLGDIPLSEPEVLDWIREYIREGERGIC
jgi:anti-sigma regulatory factor (Ser/Thr protein kinase)